MLKKSISLAVSITALLAAGASAAQATGPLVTNSLGEAAKTIEATSTNTTVTTSVGTTECTILKVTSSIESNENTTVRGKGSGTWEGTPKGFESEKYSGHCGTSSGALTEITFVTISDLHLTKHGAETTGTMAFSFTYDMRNSTGGSLIAECTFGGTIPVKKTGASSINVEGEIKKTAGSLFCPGSGTFKGDFSVTADGKGAATIH
jgi:hypothetical protein